MNLKEVKYQPGALTASYACTDENLLSQIEQDGCHAEDVFMCCRRASLLLKYRFSHWGQVGILVEIGTQYKKERKGGQRRGAALSDEESMGEGKGGRRVEGDLYGEAMRCHAALSCSQVG